MCAGQFKVVFDLQLAAILKDVEVSEEMLAAIPQKYIRALYINGEQFKVVFDLQLAAILVECQVVSLPFYEIVVIANRMK